MPTVRERIAGARNAKERAGLRAAIAKEAVEALWPASGPMAVSRGGMSIVFDERPALIRDKQGTVVGVDAMVRVFRAGNELRVDPHRICINPPTMVPDGTFIETPDGRIPNLREDPVEAYLSWLMDSLRDTPNPKGWRTKGTVTTVYAGAADAYIGSDSATYATARSGGGTLAVNSVGASVLAVGQYDGYGCFETFVDFDTSSVPDTDTVSVVELALYGSHDFSTQDFDMEARLYNWGGSVTTADWVAGASLSSNTLLATFATSGWSTSGYNTFTEDGSAFQSNLNKTGTTSLLVCSSRLTAGTTPTTSEYVYCKNADTAGTTNDPKLTVTHAAAGATGTAAVTLPNMTVAGTGAHTQSGSGAPSLPNVTASASGTQSQTGTASASLNNLSASATGVMQPSGTGAPSLPNLVAAASGTQTQTGTGTPTLPNLTATGTAASGFDATGAATLPNATASGTGTHPFTGTAAPSLPNLVAAVSGTHAQAGTVAASLPNATAAATGVMQPSGSAASTLPNLVAAASGAQAIPATGAATLPNVAATGEGGIPVTATGAATLPNLVAAASGAIPNGILLPRGGGITRVQLPRGGGRADVLSRGGGVTNTPPKRGGGKAEQLPRGGGTTQPQLRRGGGKVDGS